MCGMAAGSAGLLPPRRKNPPASQTGLHCTQDHWRRNLLTATAAAANQLGIKRRNLERSFSNKWLGYNTLFILIWAICTCILKHNVDWWKEKGRYLRRFAYICLYFSFTVKKISLFDYFHGFYIICIVRTTTDSLDFFLVGNILRKPHSFLNWSLALYSYVNWTLLKKIVCIEF